jgi:hypothetical protein
MHIRDFLREFYNKSIPNEVTWENVISHYVSEADFLQVDQLLSSFLYIKYQLQATHIDQLIEDYT